MWKCHWQVEQTLGVASQRIDLLQAEQFGPGLSSMYPARRSSNRSCRADLTILLTEINCHLPNAQLWYGQAGFVSLPGKALTQDATRRLRFDVRATGWLHTTELHRRVNNCCTF